MTIQQLSLYSLLLIASHSNINAMRTQQIVSRRQQQLKQEQRKTQLKKQALQAIKDLQDANQYTQQRWLELINTQEYNQLVKALKLNALFNNQYTNAWLITAINDVRNTRKSLIFLQSFETAQILANEILRERLKNEHERETRF